MDKSEKARKKKKTGNKHDAISYMRHLKEITQGFDACFVCFKSAAVQNQKKEMEEFLLVAEKIFEQINFNFAASFKFMQSVTGNFSRCSVQALKDILETYDIENKEKIKEIESEILDAMKELYCHTEIGEVELKRFNVRTGRLFDKFIDLEKDLISKYARCLIDANKTLTLIIESDSRISFESIQEDHPLTDKIQRLSDQILFQQEDSCVRDPNLDEDPSFLSESENSDFYDSHNRMPIGRCTRSFVSNSDEDPILSVGDEIFEAAKAAAKRKRKRKQVEIQNSQQTGCCTIC